MVTQRVERRLATILVADVVGFRPLMRVDDEGALARLKAYRRNLIEPEIASHCGRIVRAAGDSLLVELSSVVEAVRCAADLQRCMRAREIEMTEGGLIEFRIGIHLCDIISDGVDLFGEGVDCASRLEELAEPGGICISQAVHDQIRDKLPYVFEDMGEQRFKNIARPVRAFAMSAAFVASLPPVPSAPKLDKRTTATRRLAAVLAADLVGYSRLIGADEAGTLQAFKTIKIELFDPMVAAHHGRLVKTTGDGFLVEFGSVVDALHCATEIQAHMAERNVTVPTDKRLDLRIGINVGDIVVEDGDIFGDGVNVAVRLEGMAEPGGICVSARVQEDAAGKLDLAFEDLGEQQLKNIARPVRAYRIPADEAAGEMIGIVQPSLPLPDKPSVAVLPFTNMSSDPEQEFFSDGIAEDIITALSRYPSLFVIARNSCFIYKGRAVDVKQVGRELGVRYVLEGGLRKAGNRIRVTAQLVEAETGKHVWAERYDRDLADIFAVQDEITEAVTIAIAPAIVAAEQQRAMRKPPESLDAWAAYQRGLWHFDKVSAKDNALARKFFQQAVDLDPSFPGGYKGLSAAQSNEADYEGHGLSETLHSAEALARRAVALDGADAEARSLLATALRRRGDHDGGLAEAERALAISPNLAGAHAARGASLISAGRLKEGVAALERSIRLDPRRSAVRLNQIALALYCSGEYRTAVDTANRAIRSYPNYPNIYRWLAAALGQLGRIEEAKQALEKAISIAPASFDMYVRARAPWRRVEDHSHMLEGLRKAGWER